MLLAQVILDVAGEYVTCGTDAVLDHQASEGDDGDLGGAAAYVDDHVALRGLDIETDTEGGGHRLEDQIHVARSGMLGGVTDGADLDFGTARRDADHDLDVRGEQRLVLGVHLLDEAADHHLRGIEVGDHAVPEGTHGLDAGVGTLVHELGLLADGYALAGIIVDGDYAGLVENDLVVLEYDGIGRAKVHCQLLCPKRKCHMETQKNVC